VISDGEDNSSKISLKQAIAKAQQGEVAVYTVSTRDRSHEETAEVTGDRALKTLSELTGGSAFRPVSVHGLNGSLGELQEVIGVGMLSLQCDLASCSALSSGRNCGPASLFAGVGRCHHHGPARTSDD
jgi:hypothetical protein